MSFFNVIKETKDLGRLYVIRMEVDEHTVWKIGMCYSDRSTDRMMEILRSWFTVYRYLPRSSLRLDMETKVPLALEKYVHKVLKEFQWIPDKKVDGYHEMFIDLDEKVLLHYLKYSVYEGLIDEPLTQQEREYVKSMIIEDVPF